MMLRVVLLAFVEMACVPPNQNPQYAGAAQGAGAFAGTWTGNGGSLTLEEQNGQVQGQGQGQGWSAQIQGTSQGGQMTGMFAMGDGTQGQFQATSDGNTLTINVQGRPPIVFTRGGGAAGAPAMAGGAAPRKKPGDWPMPGTQAASGPPAHDDIEGWAVHTPDHWKFQPQGTGAMFGSDTEAGAILVAYTRGVTYDQLAHGAEAFIASQGATQIGDVKPFTAKAGQGIVVELEGVLDGQTLQARSIAVAGPAGVVTVTGIATPDKLPGLRKRVDEIAQSINFFTPKIPPARDFFIGTWWHYHGNATGLSSVSYERTLELCRDGTFYDSSESNGSFSNGGNMGAAGSLGAMYNGTGAGAGRWIAQGDDLQGGIRLTFNNGNVEEHHYKFRKRHGGDVDLDDKWYGAAPEKGGRCPR